MSSLDTELAELASGIRRLSKRSLVALFWACSTALLPMFRTWAAQRGNDTGPLLVDALTAAQQFAVHAEEISDATAILDALEHSTPPGDSPDEVSSTAAQDCWICADVCIRVQVDEGYDAGPAIEYALEPVLSAATKSLYGVTQVGSGSNEEAHVRAVLAHPVASAGLEFVQWATSYLQDRPAPTEADLALISSRARVLAA